jgi:D-3-phosphoglycerate dehydrogenase / 2-oxoglutarate reductase
MKIFILDPFFESGPAYAAAHATIVRWDDPAVAHWHEEADGLMIRLSKIGAADFARAKRLKAISKQGVGVENIDLAAARAHGVMVCNTPGVNAEAVAEMALALALAVNRRVAAFDSGIRSGQTVDRTRLLGREAWQKTVGIVGMGHVGTRVARKWRGAFDARIIAYDPYVPETHWPDIPHERVKSLEALVAQVDLLTLHLPLTAESRGMIDARVLAMMKPDGVVVNCARGGIVDEAALFQALQAGQIAGAGLDVFDVEPPTTANPLVSLPNVVSTPHAAGSTYETQRRIAQVTAEQLVEMLAGNPPRHRLA